MISNPNSPQKTILNVERAKAVNLSQFRRFWHPLAVVLVILIGAIFRFNNLNWDEGRLLHPDERYIAVLAGQIRPPGDLTAYFDSGKSTLNPYNTDWGRGYVYGTLPLFIPRYIGQFLDTGCAPNALLGTKPAALPVLLNALLFGPDSSKCLSGAITFYDKLVIIGRAWSALADLISVFVLYLIGRRLFGWRVGLLAAALCALAVMQIQSSHFFTVDSTANLFVTLTIYFCVLLVTDQTRWRPASLMRWGLSESRFALYGLLAGISAGCGIASKISVWPLVPLIILSVAVALIRDRRGGLVPLLSAAIALILAGVGTFASFRVAQPYSFVGNSASEFALTLQQCNAVDASALTKICAIGAQLPKFVREIIAPSSRWIEQLTLAQTLMDGSNSPPFAHQWANRTPIVFPLVNLVFWGMGIPLGLAACLGFLYCLRQVLRRRRWTAYIIPVTWGGLYFLYQSTQWTKSMRYLLPIYPTLCLCAAVALVALWRQGKGAVARGHFKWASVPSLLARVGPPIIVGAVLVGNLLWAVAFTQIYDEPVTRITASHWVFDNIPTAVTLRWKEPTGEINHLELPLTKLDIKTGAFQSIQFHLDLEKPRIVSNLEIELNHVQGDGLLEVRLTTPDGGVLLQTAQLQVDANHTVIPVGSGKLLTNEEYGLTFQLQSGSGVTARTNVVANEHWDDAVPQPVDGKDPYGNYYTGLKSSSDGQIQNYAEDIPEKQPNVLNWLDEADYLVMSSNRLYGAIPRLPWRFPMTTEYYRAMFNGELGFELVADFNSFTRLGPFTFNDQEMAQPLRRTPNTQGTPPGIQVPYPYAEEAFSVYDHPRVLIFKKTPAYSRALAEQVLGKYDLTRTIQQTPLAAINTPRGMLFDDTTRAAQEAGGTWSDLFRRDSPLNQSQPLAVIAWILLIEVLGIATFPIIAVATAQGKKTGRTLRAARNGGEEGTEGQTQGGAVPAPLSSSTPLPCSLIHPLLDGGYSFAKILALLLVAVIAWWLSSTKIAQYTPLELWAVITVVVAVGIIVFIRNQAMMLALVNKRFAIILASEIVFLVAFGLFLLIRSSNPDLWHPYMGGEKPMDFAYLNAVLRSTYFPPIDPWFSGGYINYYYFGFVIVSTPIKALGIDPSIAYNIVLPMLFGLTASGAFGIGATLNARLGSKSSYLTESRLRVTRAIMAGCIAALFVCVLGNLREIDTLVPAWQQLGGVKTGVAPVQATFDGLVKWVTGAQLPVYPNWAYWNPTRPTAGTAVDSVQIAEFPIFTFLYADLHAHMMAMPIAFLALAFALAFVMGARKWPGVVLGAIAVGSLWPTNTWDYPVYLLVCVGALVISALEEARDKPSLSNVVASLLRVAPAIIVFGILTRAFFIPYLENYGSAYNSVEPWVFERTPLDVYLTIYGLFLVPIVAFLALGVWRNLGLSTRKGVLGWGVALVAFVIGIILALRGVQIAVVVVPLAAIAFIAAIMPGTAPQTRILWLLTAGAFVLTLFVEFFTLKGDIGRMNTLFKFYIQAWLILGVTSAVLLMWVFDRIEELTHQSIKVAKVARHVVRPVFIMATAVVVFLAALYPIFAIPAKLADRYVSTAPRGLDGMAYMATATRTEGKQNQVNDFPLVDDMQAIKWMQDHVKGSPVIIEGTTGGDLYLWGNRFSIYTGLPAVVGWQWHERQQRAALNDRIVYDRDADLDTFYSTPDIQQALVMIRRYNAKYVILGMLEKSYYNPAGLPKFDEMVQNGFLRIAYQNTGTTVYEVNDQMVSPLSSASAFVQ